MWHDLYHDLNQMGHDTEVLLYPDGAFSETEAFGRKMIKKVCSDPFDLILIIKGEIISYKTIQEIKNSCSSKIAVWTIDDPFMGWDENGPPLYFEAAVQSYAYYDRVFLFDSFFCE